MDGAILIDKPEGKTSHDVVAKLRRILHAKKIGHTGTLDPFATGLLVMLVGKATRLAQFVAADEKEYEAVVHFGSETDTGDRTGTPKGDADADAAAKLKATDRERIIDKFRGPQVQTPPMYSAKKIEGKKLYELARKGVEVEREPVPIVIHELEIYDITGDAAKMRVRCSAGTFIRTLAEDIGKFIGTGAHLKELRRTKAGELNIENSVTLDEIAQMPDPESRIIPMNELLRRIPAIELPVERVGKTLSGLSTRVFRDDIKDGEILRMIDDAGKLIAVGVFESETGEVRPKVVLG
jgi:tRNA pseudouridine55 synthase